jgi:pimeloyl-ACP methyl ester carboxylesterase
LIVSRHIDTPVLIGHSLGGALVTAFAQQHSNLIAGVIALDGLPVFPGMEGMTPAQRREVADEMADEVANATPEQFRKREFPFMQPPCTIDPAMDAALLPLMARSDQATVAEYMKQGRCQRPPARTQAHRRAAAGNLAVLRAGFQRATHEDDRSGEGCLLPAPVAGYARCPGGADLTRPPLRDVRPAGKTGSRDREVSRRTAMNPRRVVAAAR